MVEILDFINTKLNEANISYEFGEWTSTVTYPYFVGTFSETENRYEDGYTTGTFTLDGWSRGTKIELLKAADTIKRLFADAREIAKSSAFHVHFGNILFIPTGEADLFRVSIILYTQEWKGI